MKILVAYGTIEGQTGKIARFVEQKLGDLGHDVSLVDTGDKLVEVSFDDVDKVILAASVHERRHPKPFEVFVATHSAELEELETLVLSVSLSAAFPEGHAEARDYLDEMKMRTQLDPAAELLVAGAVRTGRYDYYASQVLRHVVMRGRDYDPAVAEHEFTDWREIETALTDFVAG